MSALPSTMNIRLPPQLTMDEYGDFVEASLRECDRTHAMRQKEIEKRIKKPFRLTSAHEKHQNR